jgi:succinyl-CoA synthetase alpha subunit
MAILVDGYSRVMVQGITGREGSFHAARMLAAGTKVVAGVTPGKGGRKVAGVPVFNSIPEAVAATGAEVSVLFVPAKEAKKAIIRAATAGIRLAIVIAEGIPIRDMTEVVAELGLDEDPLTERRFLLVGPNCPGVVTPGGCNAGIMAAPLFTSGPVGIISRSGTLTYEIARDLTRAGLGQSTCVGIGGDPVHGLGFVECLQLFESDPHTEVVVLVGEIGGNDEELAARFVAAYMTKPVVAYIAGFTAPPGRRMGHAGAIISGSSGTAVGKAAALEAVGIAVARRPDEAPRLVAEAIAARSRGSQGNMSKGGLA